MSTYPFFCCSRHSYVCLFSSKIGYSLSTTPNVICNFLSMDEISGAVPEDAESQNYNAECSFIVQVQEWCDLKSTDLSTDLSGTSCRNESNCCSSTSAGTPYDFSHRNGAEKVSQFHAKPFYLRASCKAERDQWINDINSAVLAHRKDKANQTNQRNHAFYRHQLRLRSFYTSFSFQAATAFLVALNFFVTVRLHPQV
jgi:hypothetical protein